MIRSGKRGPARITKSTAAVAAMFGQRVARHGDDVRVPARGEDAQTAPRSLEGAGPALAPGQG